MSRERTKTVQCAEAGCRETTFYSYTSQREYAEITKRQAERPYKCTRHSDPDQVLRPDNTERTHVLVASRVPFKSRYGDGPEWLRGLFWLEEGRDSGSGFTFGPGFKAHASDFPEGTRLVVTAHVEMPAPSVEPVQPPTPPATQPPATEESRP
jgi:hypothetical protein